MARIEQALFEYLTGRPGLSALVGTRIFPLRVPELVTKPMIHYERISGPRMMSHGGPTGTANPRYQFNCWGDTYEQAKDVADQVRFALDGLQQILTVTSEIFVKDLFTGTTGDDITTHTPDVAPSGAAWAGYGPAGSLAGSIQSNELRITDNGDGSARGFIIESGVADGQISLKFTGNSINPAFGGIAFRDDGVDRWTLRQVASSNLTELIDESGVLADSATLVSGINDVIEFTLTLLGTSISAVVKNVSTGISVTVTATDTSNQTATIHGVASRTAFGAGAGDRYDDFIVQEPVEEVRVQAGLVVDDRDDFEEQSDQFRIMVDAVIWHDEETS